MLKADREFKKLLDIKPLMKGLNDDFSSSMEKTYKNLEKSILQGNKTLKKAQFELVQSELELLNQKFSEEKALFGEYEQYLTATQKKQLDKFFHTHEDQLNKMNLLLKRHYKDQQKQQKGFWDSWTEKTKELTDLVQTIQLTGIKDAVADKSETLIETLYDIRAAQGLSDKQFRDVKKQIFDLGDKVVNETKGKVGHNDLSEAMGMLMKDNNLRFGVHDELINELAPAITYATKIGLGQGSESYQKMLEQVLTGNYTSDVMIKTLENIAALQSGTMITSDTLIDSFNAFSNELSAMVAGRDDLRGNKQAQEDFMKRVNQSYLSSIAAWSESLADTDSLNQYLKSIRAGDFSDTGLAALISQSGQSGAQLQQELRAGNIEYVTKSLMQGMVNLAGKGNDLMSANLRQQLGFADNDTFDKFRVYAKSVNEGTTTIESAFKRVDTAITDLSTSLEDRLTETTHTSLIDRFKNFVMKNPLIQGLVNLATELDISLNTILLGFTALPTIVSTVKGMTDIFTKIAGHFGNFSTAASTTATAVQTTAQTTSVAIRGVSSVMKFLGKAVPILSAITGAFTGISGIFDLANAEKELDPKKKEKMQDRGVGKILGVGLGAGIGLLAGPVGAAIGAGIGGMLGDFFGEWIGKGARILTNAIFDVGTYIVTGLWDAIKWCWKLTFKNFKFVFGGIKKFVGWIWKGLSKLTDWFKGVFGKGFDAVKNLLSSIPDIPTILMDKLGTLVDSIVEIPKSIASDLKDSFTSLIDSLKGLLTNPIDAIGQELAKLNPFTRIDGSHKTGLDRVPKDGYIGELHKDEAVLTKEEANTWRTSKQAFKNIEWLKDQMAKAVIRPIPQLQQLQQQKIQRQVENGQPLPYQTPAFKGNKEDFLKAILPGTYAGWKKYGILPSLTLSQAVLESGWGKHHMGANNLFGIKTGSQWKGPYVVRETREETKNGKSYTVNAKFRAYPDFNASVLDRSEFLAKTGNGRYTPVLRAKDYIDATRLIKECGYATDTKYTNKLRGIIEENNFQYFDNEANFLKRMKEWGLNIPQYKEGNDRVQKDQIALVHKGEMIVPAHKNPNNVATTHIPKAPKSESSKAIQLKIDEVITVLRQGFEYLGKKLDETKKSEPEKRKTAKREFKSKQYFES